jgi:hypothetical protein
MVVSAAILSAVVLTKFDARVKAISLPWSDCVAGAIGLLLVGVTTSVLFNQPNKLQR